MDEYIDSPLMDLRLTPRDVWISTLFFAVASLFLAIPLQFLTRNRQLASVDIPILLGSAVFWAIMSILFVRRFWDIYYRYFYPDWVKSLWPLSPVLYMAIGFGMWRIALTLRPTGLLPFCLLGGVEGIAEHILAVYAFRVLDKVPFLQGLKPIPVLLFSFFEYICYWAIVGWVALGMALILPLME